MVSPEATVVFDYNYARGAIASANQLLWPPGRWDISMLVDGNLNGVFHGDSGLQPGFAYTIDLRDVINLEKLNIYPRQDICCPERLTNFRVSIHNDNNGQIGDQVWSGDFFTDGSNPVSGAGSVFTITPDLGTGTFKGRWIKIMSLEDPVQNYALQMTELQAIGTVDSASVRPTLGFTMTAGGPQLNWSDGSLRALKIWGPMANGYRGLKSLHDPTGQTS